MNIEPKTYDQVKPAILAELEHFRKVRPSLSFTNVTESRHICNILSPHMEKHAPVRSSYEYQLFLSISRKTPTYDNFLKTKKTK